ncbi:hypothetical protein CVT25_007657 [Psilocybe cyanescens]|uniref:Reverse transcriptase Ty1/copia-type domain-containing protein n=1 Tax=Psilocybe cyanescens TaxID=93625 RepID=A0A409X198_PSICY|nr:hypothetical protein CVT25_007657 [Psilocybe cyanescens]
MGYPPGGRGYRLRDIKSLHFFNSSNVIFDENIPYQALHRPPVNPIDYSSLPFLPPIDSAPTVPCLSSCTDSTVSVSSVAQSSASNSAVAQSSSSNDPISSSCPVDSSSVSSPCLVTDGDLDAPELVSDINSPSSPLIPILVEPVTPVRDSVPHSSLPPTPDPIRTLPRRSSSRERRPTERGSFHARLVEASVQHREKLRVNREAREAEGSSTGAPDAGPAVPVHLDNDNPFASLCCMGALDDRPLRDCPISHLTVSLDVEDYLSRDNDALWESTLLSVRSDIRRVPSSPGYDMSIPPANYAEAMARSDADEWRKVVVKELEMLKSMGVYVDDVLPDGVNAIGCRWVLEFKLLEIGGPPIYKARLVAQGFSQIPFVDYDATFAPVAKSVSIRFIAVYAAIHAWHLECFDATRAFLWGDLTETIYMRCPQGYSSPFKGVWRLLKSLYGLKQASRVWYKLLCSVLEKLGFNRLEFDHAVFIFKRWWGGGNVHCLLGMHVDDGLGGSNSSEFLRFIKEEIGKAFGIKDLGPVKEFLGVQFERDLGTRELWIHQEPYIDALLDEYGLINCNPVSTPIDVAHPFGRETDIHPIIPNLVTAFQRLIGSLLFIQRHSRPDISVAVLLLSQHCSKPSSCHFAAAKRVLRYLSGTRSLRLHYGGTSSGASLYGYSDADWAGDKVTRASTSGFLWTMAGGPISWSSKTQTCIATSSTESEYVALTRALQEGLWLRASLAYLQLPCPTPLIIATDNEGARSLSENDSSHSKAKHIDICYHFIRSHIESQTFQIVHTSGITNPADILTKPLHRLKFLEAVERLGFAIR